jgi:hypothetical protein
LSFKVALIALCVAVSVVVACACGNVAKGDRGSRVLSAEEAKQLLLELPYRYKFRTVESPKGASGALAGRVTTSRGTFLNFGVALGRDADGVPVPKAGTGNAYGYPYGGFTFTDDTLIPSKKHKWHSPARFRTSKQWHEAVNMGVEMQEKLCMAATGKPCPP